MLSICIPIYNQDVTKLVTDLNRQMKQVDFSVELILIDDCSEEEFKLLNKNICGSFQYYQLEKNVGRAKIRNLFILYAAYEYLLFLDCDAEVISENLLADYYPYCVENTYDVICGSSIYSSEKPPRNKYLRWKNGHKREMISPEKRMQTPYGSFMTSNVLIKKAVFELIKFDESLTKYGHEDTLFGYALMKKQVPLLHINNPVLNADLDTNVVFLQKTEYALNNLVLILEKIDYNPEFIANNKLLSLYFSLDKKGLIPLVRLGYYVMKTMLKAILKAGFANLYLFDIYKLGTLSASFSQKK